MVGVIKISWENGHCQSWIVGKVLKMFKSRCCVCGERMQDGALNVPRSSRWAALLSQPDSYRWVLLWTCLRIIPHCVLHSGPDLKSVETFASGPYIFKDLRSLRWTPIKARGTVWCMGCTSSDFPVHWRVNEVEVCPFSLCIPPDSNILSQEAPSMLCSCWSEKSGEAAKAGKASEALRPPVSVWHRALNSLRELQALLCLLGSLAGSLRAFPQVGGRL